MGSQYIMVKIIMALSKVDWLIGKKALSNGAMVFSETGYISTNTPTEKK
jgi:hypothetical protein